MTFFLGSNWILL